MFCIINLKKYRKQKGLTQQQLADKVNITQQYIAALEQENSNNSPTLEVILNLCYALEVCPYDLLQFNCTEKNKVGLCNNCRKPW